MPATPTPPPAQSKQYRGLLIGLFAALTFGLYPAAAKAAYAQGANAVFVVIFTTFARALALVVFCLLTGKKLRPNAKQRSAALSGGACQALSVFGIIGSLVFLPAAVTITLMFTHTLMLMAFMVQRGELPFTVPILLSAVLSLLGVSFVVDVWQSSAALDVRGVALAFLAALATALRLYLFGKEVLQNHPAVVGAQIFSVASLCTLLLCLFENPVAPTGGLGFLWLTLCALALVLGTFAMFYGIALLGSFQWSLMAKLEPLFTALFAFLVMGESLHFSQYFGMLLLLGSLAFYQFYARRA
jgi:drug/metabolite transporter (DMT)-like permease